MPPPPRLFCPGIFSQIWAWLFEDYGFVGNSALLESKIAKELAKAFPHVGGAPWKKSLHYSRQAARRGSAAAWKPTVTQKNLCPEAVKLLEKTPSLARVIDLESDDGMPTPHESEEDEDERPLSNRAQEMQAEAAPKPNPAPTAATQRNRAPAAKAAELAELLLGISHDQPAPPRAGTSAQEEETTVEAAGQKSKRSSTHGGQEKRGTAKKAPAKKAPAKAFIPREGD